jgi:CO/xanthine dehydrogenase FAD-binding subunit
MVAVDTYQTMAEAAGALGEGTRYLGGGTIVMRAVNYGDQSFHRIVRATQVERGVASDMGGMRIGAGTTMAEILATPDLSFLHPVARQIGGPAVRNMATVGGNLFAENPYGDLGVALLALDAQIVMTSDQTQPIESFFSDRGHIRSVVAAVVVPRVDQGTFYFNKVSRVKPRGVSVMSIAALMRHGDPRVAFGNMSPKPTRARGAERALANGVNEASIDAACAICTEGMQPVDDSLASAWYRLEVAPVHLKRLLRNGGRV